MANLGTEELGTEELAGDAYFVATSPADGQGTTLTLTRVSAPGYTEPTAAVTSSRTMNPVSLDPNNLYVFYDEDSSEFRTNWFTKYSPLDNSDSLDMVIVGRFNQTGEPVDIIVERDEDGDGVADVQSPTVTLKNNEHVAVTSSATTGKELAVEGDRFRLRFPNYTQANALERLNLALTWDDESAFNELWGISKTVRPTVEPQKSLFSTIYSENYQLDATFDEIFESHHIESSSGKSLERLGTGVDVVRKEGETDPQLRKRVLGNSATRTFQTTGPNVADLLTLLFEDRVDEVSVGVAQNEPVLNVDVPQSVIDDAVLTASEFEDIITEGVASSYSATVTVV